MPKKKKQFCNRLLQSVHMKLSYFSTERLNIRDMTKMIGVEVFELCATEWGNYVKTFDLIVLYFSLYFTE